MSYNTKETSLYDKFKDILTREKLEYLIKDQKIKKTKREKRKVQIKNTVLKKEENPIILKSLIKKLINDENKKSKEKNEKSKQKKTIENKQENIISFYEEISLILKSNLTNLNLVMDTKNYLNKLMNIFEEKKINKINLKETKLLIKDFIRIVKNQNDNVETIKEVSKGFTTYFKNQKELFSKSYNFKIENFQNKKLFSKKIDEIEKNRLEIKEIMKNLENNNFNNKMKNLKTDKKFYFKEFKEDFSTNNEFSEKDLDIYKNKYDKLYLDFKKYNSNLKSYIIGKNNFENIEEILERNFLSKDNLKNLKILFENFEKENIEKRKTEIKYYFKLQNSLRALSLLLKTKNNKNCFSIFEKENSENIESEINELKFRIENLSYFFNKPEIVENIKKNSEFLKSENLKDLILENNNSITFPINPINFSFNKSIKENPIELAKKDDLIKMLFLQGQILEKNL